MLDVMHTRSKMTVLGEYKVPFQNPAICSWLRLRLCNPDAENTAWDVAVEVEVRLLQSRFQMD